MSDSDDNTCEECVEKQERIDRIKDVIEVRDSWIKQMNEKENTNISFLRQIIFGYIGFRIGCSVSNYFKEK